MKHILYTISLFCIFGKLYSQNIVGKWAMIEFEDREVLNFKIPVDHKTDRIILTLNSDGTYIKEFYEFNPFDNFRSELPEVNTVTDKIKKIPNKKIKVKGAYFYDGKETLSLVRDNKTVEYKIYFEGNKLVIINDINDSNGTMKIYQRYEKDK